MQIKIRCDKDADDTKIATFSKMFEAFELLFDRTLNAL